MTNDLIGRRVRWRDFEGKTHTGIVECIKTHQIAVVRTKNSGSWWVSPDKLVSTAVEPIEEDEAGG